MSVQLVLTKNLSSGPWQNLHPAGDSGAYACCACCAIGNNVAGESRRAHISSIDPPQRGGEPLVAGTGGAVCKEDAEDAHVYGQMSYREAFKDKSIKRKEPNNHRGRKAGNGLCDASLSEIIAPTITGFR